MKNLTFLKVREKELEEVDLHFKILLSIIIGKHMKMFLFKFNRNRTITKNYVFEEEEGPPILNFNLNYYWKTYENVMFQILAKSHHI